MASSHCAIDHKALRTAYRFLSLLHARRRDSHDGLFLRVGDSSSFAQPGVRVYFLCSGDASTVRLPWELVTRQKFSVMLDKPSREVAEEASICLTNQASVPLCVGWTSTAQPDGGMNAVREKSCVGVWPFLEPQTPPNKYIFGGHMYFSKFTAQAKVSSGVRPLSHVWP